MDLFPCEYNFSFFTTWIIYLNIFSAYSPLHSVSVRCIYWKFRSFIVCFNHVHSFSCLSGTFSSSNGWKASVYHSAADWIFINVGFFFYFILLAIEWKKKPKDSLHSWIWMTNKWGRWRKKNKKFRSVCNSHSVSIFTHTHPTGYVACVYELHEMALPGSNAWNCFIRKRYRMWKKAAALARSIDRSLCVNTHIYNPIYVPGVQRFYLFFFFFFSSSKTKC